jgi:hypothetical protein
MGAEEPREGSCGIDRIAQVVALLRQVAVHPGRPVECPLHGRDRAPPAAAPAGLAVDPPLSMDQNGSVLFL